MKSHTMNNRILHEANRPGLLIQYHLVQPHSLCSTPTCDAVNSGGYRLTQSISKKYAVLKNNGPQGSAEQQKLHIRSRVSTVRVQKTRATSEPSAPLYTKPRDIIRTVAYHAQHSKLRGGTDKDGRRRRSCDEACNEFFSKTKQGQKHIAFHISTDLLPQLTTPELCPRELP